MSFVAPDYGGASLAEVLPAVARAVGHPLDGSGAGALVLPEAPAYVVMLVDGLGARLLDRHPEEAPFLSSLRRLRGTCAVPSTTATSLTTLGTALPPGAHGLVGFTSRIPGTSRILQALQWDADVDPVQYQPHDTAFGRLERAGVATTAITKPAFEFTGLTVSSQRGARFAGATELADRVGLAVRAAATTPSVTYVYDSDLDATGHLHGTGSAQWRRALDEVDTQAERLRDELPDTVRLLVLADHGMVDAHGGDRIDIDAVDGLRDGIALVAGEARLRHLYCRSGAVADVVATWRSLLGDRALVLSRDEAIQRGWFGPVEDRVRPRLGDVVVAATGRTGLFSTTDFSFEARLVGLHGSLTAEEMEIPLLVG